MEIFPKENPFSKALSLGEGLGEVSL